jgi:hypothetical protein
MIPTCCYKHIWQGDVNQDPILGRFMKIKQRLKSRATVPLTIQGTVNGRETEKLESKRSKTKINLKQNEAKFFLYFFVTY